MASLVRKPFDVLFLGSDAFSITALSILLKRKDIWNSISVVTPPPQRTGRGLKTISIPPLSDYAEKMDISVTHIPNSGIKSWELPTGPPTPSSILMTASFGYMIPSAPLSLYPPSRRLNLHPSRLPKYRGAAPIQWALLDGLEETAVTLQSLSIGKIDRGEIWQQENFTIPPNSTYNSIIPPLAELGGSLLVKHLESLLLDPTAPTAGLQNPSEATNAPKITPQQGYISFSQQTASDIDRVYRAIGHQVAIRTAMTGKASKAHGGELAVDLDELSLVPWDISPDISHGECILDGEGDRLLIGAARDGRRLLVSVKKLKLEGFGWVSASGFIKEVKKRGLWKKGEKILLR